MCTEGLIITIDTLSTSSNYRIENHRKASLYFGVHLGPEKAEPQLTLRGPSRIRRIQARG
jgi:hypothetical protein